MKQFSRNLGLSDDEVGDMTDAEVREIAEREARRFESTIRCAATVNIDYDPPSGLRVEIRVFLPDSADENIVGTAMENISRRIHGEVTV